MESLMFCPKCGNADQVPETYCRQCGTFLPDLSKPVKRPIKPEEHVTANITLSVMTIVTSFALSILIFSLLTGEGAHPLIYVTAGFLIAIGCWHLQTLWRTLMLRKHFRESKPPREPLTLDATRDVRSLSEPDVTNIVPDSVTAATTRRLTGTKRDR